LRRRRGEIRSIGFSTYINHALHTVRYNVHMDPSVHAGFAHPKTNTDALGVKPGMVVVDFGAGSGAYVWHVAEQLKGSGMVYAVDVQNDLLRRIKNEAERKSIKVVETIWGDIEKREGSKLADACADIVLMSNILFQLDDKRAGLTEARRILKDDGVLAIIDWTSSHGGMGPQPRDVVHKDAAIVLAHESGFDLASDFAAGAHHYGLLMKKSPYA
jgi:ubiquinone/menaquinone biosynthesis C-methylase UbiE